jgi:hypothetical protein
MHSCTTGTGSHVVITVTVKHMQWAGQRVSLLKACGVHCLCSRIPAQDSLLAQQSGVQAELCCSTALSRVFEACSQHAYAEVSRQRAHVSRCQWGRHAGQDMALASHQGMAQHSTSHQGMAQHSTSHQGMAWHSTSHQGMAQHSTAQHSTAQHSTAQHSTAQHSTALLGSSRTVMACSLSCMPCVVQGAALQQWQWQ